MKPFPKVKPQINTTRELVEVIKTSLSKLSVPYTVDEGLEELREIMKFHISNHSRMNLLISIIVEQLNNMSNCQKKEAVKAFVMLGEIFAENLLPFFSHIISALKSRWENSNFHILLSDAFGKMIHKIFERSKDSVVHFKEITKVLLSTIRETDKNIQIGAAMCLTRTIQNVPLRTLMTCLYEFVSELELLLKIRTIDCTIQLMEMLITLIISSDYLFEDYVDKFLPILLIKINDKTDWLMRKLAIDALAAMSEFILNGSGERMDKIIMTIKKKKDDESDHVRKAVHDALNKLGEGNSDDEESFETPPQKDRRIVTMSLDSQIHPQYQEEYKSDKKIGNENSLYIDRNYNTERWNEQRENILRKQRDNSPEYYRTARYNDPSYSSQDELMMNERSGRSVGIKPQVRTGYRQQEIIREKYSDIRQSRDSPKQTSKLSDPEYNEYIRGYLDKIARVFYFINSNSNS